MVKFLTVLSLGALSPWLALPAGIALQLSPLAIWAALLLGPVFEALAVVLLGERVRSWLLQRFGPKRQRGPHRLVYRVWDRYGVVGFGLVAPLFIGAPLAAAAAIALGATARRVLLWTLAGTVLWTTVVTLAAILGWTGIQNLLG